MKKLVSYLWSNKSFKDRINGKGCIGIRFAKSFIDFFKDKKEIKLILFDEEINLLVNDRFFKYPIFCNRQIKKIITEKNLHSWKKNKNPKIVFKIINDYTLKLIEIL